MAVEAAAASTGRRIPASLRPKPAPEQQQQMANGICAAAKAAAEAQQWSVRLRGLQELALHDNGQARCAVKKQLLQIRVEQHASKQLQEGAQEQQQQQQAAVQAAVIYDSYIAGSYDSMMQVGDALLVDWLRVRRQPGDELERCCSDSH
jgi:hypothetical protein